MITYCSAVQTSFNTGLVFVVSFHDLAILVFLKCLKFMPIKFKKDMPLKCATQRCRHEKQQLITKIYEIPYFTFKKPENTRKYHSFFFQKRLLFHNFALPLKNPGFIYVIQYCKTIKRRGTGSDS